MGNLGVWIALGALALTVITSVVTVAFFLGRVFERQASHGRRLTKLEDGEKLEAGSMTQLTLAVGRLEAEVSHVVGDVGDIKKNFGWMGRVADARERAPGT